MLTSFFQAEQSVNSLFFLYVWIFSLEWVLNCLLFSAFPYRREEAAFFFLLPQLPGRGEGDRDRRYLLEFSRVFIEGRSCAQWGHTHPELLSYVGPCTKLLCLGAAGEVIKWLLWS